MKALLPLLLSALALAACSEPPPPPAPPKPKAEAPAPIAAAPAPEAPKAPEPPEPKADPNKALAAKVKQALDEPDSRLPSGAIDVTAADGKVTLWGTAPSDAERARAAQAAGKVEGVKAVENKIAVVRGS
jgi:hypothetical protein